MHANSNSDGKWHNAQVKMDKLSQGISQLDTSHTENYTRKFRVLENVPMRGHKIQSIRFQIKIVDFTSGTVHANFVRIGQCYES